VEDLTVTVGGAGDFATIQAAVDWFKSWIVKGDCYIDCDAAAYDEQPYFANILIAPGAKLTLRGDTRLMAGMTFIDGCPGNSEAKNNAICGTTDGIMTLVGNNGQPNITVTNAGGGNPDYDADGWVNGDRILVNEWNGAAFTVSMYTVSAVLNNVITLTANLANGGVSTGGVGDDGAAICLLPNRSLEPTANGNVVTIDGMSTVGIEGFYIEPNDASVGVYIINPGASGTVSKILCWNCSTAMGAFSNAWIESVDGCISSWECVYGMAVSDYAGGKGYYSSGVGCTSANVYSNTFSYVFCYASHSTNCANGVRCQFQAAARALSSYARHCTVGYQSLSNAYIEAAATMAGNFNNGTDYTPNPAGAGQWAESAVNFGVMFKS